MQIWDYKNWGYSYVTNLQIMKECQETNLWMTVSLNVELSKGTHITHTSHVHCEVAQEVNNVKWFVAKLADKDERCHYGTDQLLQQIYLSHAQSQLSCTTLQTTYHTSSHDIIIAMPFTSYACTYRLILEESGELRANCLCVGVTSPVIRYIMDVWHNKLHKHFRTPHQILHTSQVPCQ